MVRNIPYYVNEFGCPECLAALADTGCLFVTTAVDSFDDEVLRRLAKGYAAADLALRKPVQPKAPAQHAIERAGGQPALEEG